MSQVNFFALACDEHDLFAAFTARSDTRVVAGRTFDSSELRYESSLPDANVTRLTLVHTELLGSYPPVRLSVAPYEGRYAFDLFNSAHIEWSRSEVQDNALVSGRLYAKVGWLSSAQHNKLYRSWYAAVERTLKRSLTRLDSVWWITPAAEAWSRAGGVLAFGSGPSMRRSLAEAGAT